VHEYYHNLILYKSNKLEYITMEFNKLQQIVESNSRAIQALADRIAELTHDIEGLTEAGNLALEERSELRRATIGIANLISSLDSDRPTILRKLNSIENKVDRIYDHISQLGNSDDLQS
jgi:chromosome segregation ATPase